LPGSLPALVNLTLLRHLFAPINSLTGGIPPINTMTELRRASGLGPNCNTLAPTQSPAWFNAVGTPRAIPKRSSLMVMTIRSDGFPIRGRAEVARNRSAMRRFDFASCQADAC